MMLELAKNLQRLEVGPVLSWFLPHRLPRPVLLPLLPSEIPLLLQSFHPVLMIF